jgi:hypothetical protein
MTLLTALGFGPRIQGTRVGRSWQQRVEDLEACAIGYSDKTVLDAWPDFVATVLGRSSASSGLMGLSIFLLGHGFSGLQRFAWRHVDEAPPHAIAWP